MDKRVSARPFRRLFWPRLAKKVLRADEAGLPSIDAGITATVAEAVLWLLRAQRNSASRDGGVARHYSLFSGWSTSYPETTGYIVPTLLDYANNTGESEVARAAVRMLDWLVSIQMDSGAFQAGRIDANPRVPVTFNTGQILLGLARGSSLNHRIMSAMKRAASWLRDTQDEDGCWRRFPTPFAAPGEKAYETHVAWGLLEAERASPGSGYADAALRNLEWALRQQRENGWVDKCCLTDPKAPLTHTIGYYLRGMIEGHRFFQTTPLLEAARRLADALVTVQRSDGSLPGRLTERWSPAAEWTCLTGLAQISCCWLYLFTATSDARYLNAARRANKFARRTIALGEGVPEPIRGGVKGSFPVDGSYGWFEYLNWAAKFFIDANLLEAALAAPPTDRPAS